MPFPTSTTPSYAWHLRLSLAALAAMACLPFLNPHHYNPIPSFYAEWWAAALGVAAATIFMRQPARSELRFPLIALAPFALILLFLAQLLAGKVYFVQQGLLFALYLLWASLMALLGRVLAREVGLERLAEALATGILAGGMVSLGIVALQFLGVQPGLEFMFPVIGQQVFGNLGQRNQFADYLWLGIISATYLHSRQRLGRGAFLATALPLAACAIFTASRSVYLYIASVGLITYAMSRGGKMPRPLWQGFGAVIGFCLLAELGKHLLGAADVAMPTAGDRLFNEIGSLSIRLSLWQVAWKSFLAAPLLGVGIGQFSWQSFALAGQVPPGTLHGAAEHTHNLFLQLLAEFGVGSALALLLVGIAAWLDIRRQTWSAAHWWGLAVLTVVGIHSQLEYPLWYAFFLGPVAIILGALAPRPLSVGLEKLGLWGLGLIFALSTWVLGNLYRDYSLLEDTMNWRDLATVGQSPWPEIHRKLEMLYGDSLFPQYVELYYALAAPIGRDNLDEKLQITAEVMRFSPVDRLVFKYPALLALAGRRNEAATMLATALTSYPQLAGAALGKWRLLAQTNPELVPFLPILEGAAPAQARP